MRDDHRPYAVKRLLAGLEYAWARHFLRPQLDSMGRFGMIMKPWHVKVHGPNICFGECVHVVAARDRTVRLTTWRHDQSAGHIRIGDFALLCPGVRIDAATCVEVGSNCMLAAGVYITDADWHDLYDRTRPIGHTHAVTLEDNVWLGDGCTVCKGVVIGANTIVGAGSVVTRSLPANVIAAGNPARVVRALDSAQAITRRQDLLADATLGSRMRVLERTLLQHNRWWTWLRSLISPTNGD